MLHRSVLIPLLHPTRLRRLRRVPAVLLAVGLTAGLLGLGPLGSAAADDPRGRAHDLHRGEAHALPEGDADDGAAPDRRFVPHPSTVVEVRGNRRVGFEVWHYDGARDYPPTASETRAECDEYDVRFRRAACWAQARTQFNAWRDLKRAIDYQQAIRRG